MLYSVLVYKIRSPGGYHPPIYATAQDDTL